MPASVRREGRPRARIAPARVRRWAERMLAAMRLEERELSILLCDDRTIHALNHAYRRKDRPTDVLAFAMGEGAHAGLHPEVLGDVVISLDTTARQARAHARSIEEEAAMLLAHGLLHLLGLDHRDRREERRMSARTDLLRAVARSRGKGR